MQRKGKLCARAGVRFGEPNGRTAVFIAVLAAAFSIMPSRAQSPDAAALLQQSLQAHGGAAALAQLGDTISEGRIRRELGGPQPTEYDFRIEARGFQQWRTTLQGSERLTVRAFDGSFGWVEGRSGIRPVTARAAANRINPFNPVLGVFRAQRAGEVQLESLGTDVLNGRPVHRLRAVRLDRDSVRLERGRPIDRAYEVAIDMETFLIAELALASTDWDSSRPGMWERYEYSDYRRIEGLVFPFRILKSRYGAIVEEVLLTDFRTAALEEDFPR